MMTVDKLKQMFPRNTGVRCIKMDDEQAVPSGTIGTVVFVDDIGTIHVNWQTGSSLGLVYGVDKFEIVAHVTTLKYGQPRPYADHEYEFVIDTTLSEEELKTFCKNYPCAGCSKEEFDLRSGDLSVYFGGWHKITRLSDGRYRYFACMPYAD